MTFFNFYWFTCAHIMSFWQSVDVSVEYRKIFIVLFCCCEMYFGAPSKTRKGWVISLKNLHSNSSFFSIQQKNKKVKKHFDIQWREFQNLTTFPNDILKLIISNSTILFRPGFHCHMFLQVLSHFRGFEPQPRRYFFLKSDIKWAFSYVLIY